MTMQNQPRFLKTTAGIDVLQKKGSVYNAAESLINNLDQCHHPIVSQASGRRRRQFITQQMTLLNGQLRVKEDFYRYMIWSVVYAVSIYQNLRYQFFILKKSIAFLNFSVLGQVSKWNEFVLQCRTLITFGPNYCSLTATWKKSDIKSPCWDGTL